MSAFKPPQVVLHEELKFGANDTHYHEWSCGCKSRITETYFEIIYCREDCPLYGAFKEENSKLKIT